MVPERQECSLYALNSHSVGAVNDIMLIAQAAKQIACLAMTLYLL